MLRPTLDLRPRQRRPCERAAPAWARAPLTRADDRFGMSEAVVLPLKDFGLVKAKVPPS
jgi:hypothetical protein